MFQSAPLTKARGDFYRAVSAGLVAKFQSAPLTKARGDPKFWYDHQYPVEVSIRSPHQSKGRRSSTGWTPRLMEFQSAPLTKARGDPLWSTAGAVHYDRFNPLPSPKQGETSASAKVVPPDRVSIRSPHQSKGRLWVVSSSHPSLRVSIRSPHQSKGRPSAQPAGLRSLRWFQSAPLTKARGDRPDPV